MCLIGLIVFALVIILLAIVAFVKTAFISLPWTISATVISVVVGVLVGVVPSKLNRNKRMALATPVAIVMTLVIGFGLVSIFPLKAPPERKQESLEALTRFPEPTLQEVKEHFPAHLLIWSLLGGASTALLVSVMTKETMHGDNSQSQGTTQKVSDIEVRP